MVKFIMFLLFLSMSLFANGQTDTLKCKEYFAYYEALLGEGVISIWERTPILKESSQKHIYNLKKITKKQTNYEYIFISMIIDIEGIPVCFRFEQEVEMEIKDVIIAELKLLRFIPALSGNKEVESIYTLKISR